MTFVHTGVVLLSLIFYSTINTSIDHKVAQDITSAMLKRILLRKCKHTLLQTWHNLKTPLKNHCKSMQHYFYYLCDQINTEHHNHFLIFYLSLGMSFPSPGSVVFIIIRTKVKWGDTAAKGEYLGGRGVVGTQLT